MNRRHILAILGASAFLVLLLIVVPRLPYRFGGNGTTTGVRLVQDAGEVSLYFNRSRWVPEQLVPYRDVFIEYPQLAAFYLAWPRFLGVDFPMYTALLLWSNLLALAALIMLTRSLARSLSGGARTGSWWLFLLPATLYFTLYRFDILPALAVTASLLALVRRRLGWALVLLAASIAIKWYPLVLVPLYWHWSRRMHIPRSHVLQAFGLVGGAMVVLTLIAWVTYGQGFLAPYLVHLGRTFEPGTVYVLFGTAEEPGNASVGSVVRSVLAVLQVAIPILWLIRGSRLRERLPSSTAFIAWCALAVGAFILFAKFHSPQWHLWLLPLLVLLPLPRWAVAMVVAHDAVSFVQFPILFDTVGPTAGWYLAAASIRTALLIGLLIVVARIAGRRLPDAPAASSAAGQDALPRDVHAGHPV
ncbi:MAG: DUF2029 domain-containing protein [Candidatus Kerfeldbacteria bacterium]|nr:DUF2029 domain-containing protein [Candidatus Kerfeldbacteria bacterium]